MRYFMLIVISLSSFISASCKDELTDYFYPWRQFIYEDKANRDVLWTYEMSKHNTLSKKGEIYYGVNTMPIYETIYSLQSVNSNSAIKTNANYASITKMARNIGQIISFICLSFLQKIQPILGRNLILKKIMIVLLNLYI